MGDAVVFHLCDDPGLLRRCQNCDSGRLLPLFILRGLLGVVHIDAIGIGNRQHFNKAEFRDLFCCLQEVIDPNDVVGLELVREAGGQRLNSH